MNKGNYRMVGTMDDQFDECSTCGHQRGEHLVSGKCVCDVLVSRMFEASRWARCACAEWREPVSA